MRLTMRPAAAALRAVRRMATTARATVAAAAMAAAAMVAAAMVAAMAATAVMAAAAAVAAAARAAAARAAAASGGGEGGGGDGGGGDGGGGGRRRRWRRRRWCRQRARAGGAWRRGEAAWCTSRRCLVTGGAGARGGMCATQPGMPTSFARWEGCQAGAHRWRSRVQCSRFARRGRGHVCA